MSRVRFVNTRERIERRDAALRAVRGYFHDRGFVEADTHQLVPAPGTEPHIDALSIAVRTSLTSSTTAPRYLITSPELALKRVVAAGVPRVFQIVHVFRDGERTRRHCPEFTMLEWYRAGVGSYEDVVDDTRGVVAAVAGVVGNVAGVDVDGVVRTDVAAEFAATGVDLGAALSEMRAGDPLALVKRVRAAGVDDGLAKDADFELAFFHVMAAHIEPRFARDRLTVLERWPAQMAVLARLDDDDRYARRFEAYAHGKAGVLELCNAFDELTDAVEQRRRFDDDNALRTALGKQPVPLDEDFLQALPSLPSPSAGNALGFDRLLMLLTGASDIDDVTALPWR